MTEERRNELTEEIKTGSIEKTDESAMTEIMADKELSKLHAEYEKLSSALRDAFADPPKNKEGKTLPEVLSERVRKGDVLPRYADVSKHHFPFATAACLAIACAVLLLAGKNGILGRSKYAADTAIDGSLEEAAETAEENAVLSEEASENDMQARIKEKETYLYAAGGTGIAAYTTAGNGAPEAASLDSLAGAAEETADEDAGEAETEEAENSAEKPMLMMMTAPPSTGTENTRDDKKKAEDAKAEETEPAAEKKAEGNESGIENGIDNSFANGIGNSAGNSTDNSIADSAANGKAANDSMSNGKAANGRAGGSANGSANNFTTRTENDYDNSISNASGDGSIDAYADENANENANGIVIPEDILERMEEAKLLFEEAGLEMQDDALIEIADIFRCGEDNFRAYFDSIIGEEDFTSRYGRSSFIAFCEAAEEP